jgi:hypothetical protein
LRSSIVFVSAALAALACTPKLNGTCRANADCLGQGESCGPEGLCLRAGATLPGGDDGGDGGSDAGATGATDAGDAGNSTASVEMLAPAAGAFVQGHFHVSAFANANVAITGITFAATAAATGAALGQLDPPAGSGSTYSGTLDIGSAGFGGGATIRAILHLSGLADVTSAGVSVVVDQAAPAISTSWDGGVWAARDGSFTVLASVTDDRSGVASADLLLPDGGAYAGVISGTAVSFSVPAAELAGPGETADVSFSLAATDRAGNRGSWLNASVLHVDDAPPLITDLRLDTPFDGVDGASQGWFQGPTAAPSAGPSPSRRSLPTPRWWTTAPALPPLLPAARATPERSTPAAGSLPCLAQSASRQRRRSPSPSTRRTAQEAAPSRRPPSRCSSTTSRPLPSRRSSRPTPPGTREALRSTPRWRSPCPACRGAASPPSR